MSDDARRNAGQSAFAKLLQLWESTNREQKYAANVWLMYSLFYWLLPTALAAVGLVFARRSVQPVDLWIHGEFLIYSITLTAGSTRLLAKDMIEPFPNRQLFNLAAQVIIFPAIFVYGLVRYLFATSGKDPVDVSLMTTYSVLLLVLSFLFSYVVFRIDAQLAGIAATAKQASEAIESDPKKLKSDFESLGEGGDVAPSSQRVPPPVVLTEEEDAALSPPVGEENVEEPGQAPDLGQDAEGDK